MTTDSDLLPKIELALPCFFSSFIANNENLILQGPNMQGEFKASDMPDYKVHLTEACIKGRNNSFPVD